MNVGNYFSCFLTFLKQKIQKKVNSKYLMFPSLKVTFRDLPKQSFIEVDPSPDVLLAAPHGIHENCPGLSW